MDPGVSLYLPCPEMYVPRAGEGGPGRENSDFCRILEFQAGSCPYVTAAVKPASHFGRAQGDYSGQSIFEVLGTCRMLGCTHSVHTLTRQGLPRCFNEAWFRGLLSPSIGSPFILFPFTHIFSPLFFHVLLSSCLSSHPSFRLRAHRSRP